MKATATSIRTEWRWDRKCEELYFLLLLLVILTTQFSCSLQNSELKHNQNLRLENQTLWRESKINNYRMTVNVQQPGHNTPMGFVSIEVREGILVSVKPAKPYFSGSLDKCHDCGTIEYIFEIIERAEQQAEKLEVVYETKLGYPISINIDYDSKKYDDELSLRIVEFEVLQ